MRALLVAGLLALASPAAAPEPRLHHRPSYEPPAWMMESIKALLDASRRYGVDPVLSFWVAFHESRLKPWAKGRHKNEDGTWGPVLARGLMQISVEYQGELVRKYLGWHPSAFDWSNPVHSAKLGCAMLAKYVPTYGIWGALAVYNAGEGRYKQLWKGRRLPEETILYQRKVLADFLNA
jgi:soluble lytic murein transglycosylase-like protein